MGFPLRGPIATVPVSNPGRNCNPILAPYACMLMRHGLYGPKVPLLCLSFQNICRKVDESYM